MRRHTASARPLQARGLRRVTLLVPIVPRAFYSWRASFVLANGLGRQLSRLDGEG